MTIPNHKEWRSTYAVGKLYIYRIKSVDSGPGGPPVTRHSGYLTAFSPYSNQIYCTRQFDAASLREPQQPVTGRSRALRFSKGPATTDWPAELDRELEIHQGRGSVLYTRGRGAGLVEVGGRVAFEQRLTLP